MNHIPFHTHIKIKWLGENPWARTIQTTKIQAQQSFIKANYPTYLCEDIGFKKSGIEVRTLICQAHILYKDKDKRDFPIWIDITSYLSSHFKIWQP